MKFFGALWLSVFLLLSACSEQDPQTAVSTPAQTEIPSQQIYDQRCSFCHDGSTPKAPHLIEFQIIGAKAIEDTLTNGLMAQHAQGLSQADITALALFLGGARASTQPVKRCEVNVVPATTPPTQGWSLSLEGTRFIPAEVAQLAKDQVSRLQLKWVFAHPGATRVRSQPVPFGDVVITGSQDGQVYALDLHSGCTVWQFAAAAEVRSAVAINEKGTRAFFGDIRGDVYAIDPRDGSPIWQTTAHGHPDTTITGSPRYYNGVVYVPLSSTEWGSAADPSYPCCTFRGGVVALDAVTGEEKWTAYAIEQAPSPTGESNDMGAPLHHPAGAPIWNSPTIDVQRNLLYVGTGEAYTSPAADTSDSVIAFDLSSGEKVWHYQSIAGDAWNMACFIGGGPNCPEEDGPDLDIGAPPVLVTVDGQDMLLAGQKSGDVFALNPDNGELIWRKKIGRGGFAGGIHWGLAAHNGVVFAPNADTVFTGRFTGPRKPGLFALNAADGEQLWFTPAVDVCAEEDKPACDPGLSAAVTAIPGVVFAGAFDGHLRAYDAETGAIIWNFNTLGEHASVSGEKALGGSIESDGPVVYRGHVLINSGYLFGDRMPGNALMVFAPAPN